MLPPGLTGKSDIRYKFQSDRLPVERPRQLSLDGFEQRADQPLARQLLDRLRERGPLRLRQLKVAFPKQPVQAELERLCRAGVLSSESVLAPPSARMKTTKRLYPTYLPEDIPQLAKKLGKSSQKIKLLEAIAARDEDAIGVQDALKLIGAKTRAPLKQLIDEALVFVEKTESGEQDLIILDATPERIEKQLSLWRGDAWARHILHRIAELPAPPTPQRSPRSRRRDAIAPQATGQSGDVGIARRARLARFPARLRLCARQPATAHAPTSRLFGRRSARLCWSGEARASCCMA